MDLEKRVEPEKKEEDKTSQFLHKLSERICNGTAKEDPSLSNFKGTPEQAAAYFVKETQFDESGNYSPSQIDENIRY